MPKKKPIYYQPWFIILVVVIFIGVWIMGTYNGFITMTQKIDSQWAQVETQYQRRYDLIPNLVSSVTGFMQFEKDLLTEVTALRSQWSNAATTADKIEASTGLEGALSRLLVVMENYPDIKSDQTVLGLMDELAGTENRVAVERSRYNELVRQYNTGIKIFPSNILANMFGFIEKPYFESVEGSEEVPKVDLTVG